MIVRTALLACVAGIVALGVGWKWPGLPPTPVVVTRGPAAASQLLSRSDQTTLAAIGDLAGYLGPAPSAASSADPDAVVAPSRPAPPPEPDIGPIFRRQLSAVIDPGDGRVVALLRDSGGIIPQSRILRVGDSFEGRWRLAQLTSEEAVLQRGGETRRVQLFENGGAAGGAERRGGVQGRGIGDF